MHPGPKARLAQSVGADILFLVAKDPSTGQIVGQGGLNPNSPTRPETLARFDYPTPAIAFMHVDPGFRRRRVGQKILQALSEVAIDFAQQNRNGQKEVFLTVAQENLDARAFYRAQGFADWGQGTFEMPQFERRPDGTWPFRPTLTQMTAMFLNLAGLENRPL